MASERPPRRVEREGDVAVRSGCRLGRRRRASERDAHHEHHRSLDGMIVAVVHAVPRDHCAGPQGGRPVRHARIRLLRRAADRGAATAALIASTPLIRVADRRATRPCPDARCERLTLDRVARDGRRLRVRRPVGCGLDHSTCVRVEDRGAVRVRGDDARADPVSDVGTREHAYTSSLARNRGAVDAVDTAAARIAAEPSIAERHRLRARPRAVRGEQRLPLDGRPVDGRLVRVPRSALRRRRAARRSSDYSLAAAPSSSSGVSSAGSCAGSWTASGGEASRSG
jgi:hypothetical protein